MTVTLVQLSDSHLRREDPEPARALAAAVAHVTRLVPQPLAVLVTGDVADGGHLEEYERARELLGPLDVPVHVLSGNHDDRAALRTAFGLAGEPADPIRGVAELGGLRVILCDTTQPGRDDGVLDVEWLRAELDAATATPTIVAMHHAPLALGVAGIDRIGLPADDIRALGQLLESRPSVLRVVAGHVHRAAFGVLGGCGVVSAPSTNLQLELDLAGDRLEVDPAEPPGFLIHALLDGALVTHVQPVITPGT